MARMRGAAESARCPTVLLVGPLPPPIGGVRVSFQQLVDQLKSRDDISVDLLVQPQRAGKGIARNAIDTIRLIYSIAKRARRADVLSVQANFPGAMFIGFFIWIFGRLLGKKTILRRFGGNFHHQLAALPSPVRWFLQQTVLRVDVLLLQTHELINAFESKIHARVEWYSNSRPIPKDVMPLPDGARTRFVYVGQIIPDKGVLDLVEAANQTDTSVQVDFYGPIMSHVTPEQLNTDNTRYCGVLEPGSAAATIARYHALVLPSFYQGEGYPGVVLESYSVGRPVIATRFGAIPEVVDSSCGILIDPHRPDQIAEAMDSLSHRPLLSRLAAGAMIKRELFCAEKWTQRFVDLVYELAGQPNLAADRDDKDAPRHANRLFLWRKWDSRACLRRVLVRLF